MDTVKMIAKEEIPNVKFVSYEVLNTKDEIAKRRGRIEEAMVLGNGSKGKSKIFFMAEEGMLEVETTVWSASDEVVTLKGGVMIPVHCIQKVDFL